MTAGGRWTGSRPQPVAIQRRTPAASIGCVCTGTVVHGATYGSGTETFPAGPAGIDISPVMCTADQDAQLTVVHWFDSAVSALDYTSIDLTVRSDVGFSGDVGYFFQVTTGYGGFSPLTTATATLTVNGVTPLGSASGLTLADGDVLHLSAIGTSVVAKINGSTVFSVTDSAVVAADPYSAAWEVINGTATAATVVTGFACTPTC